MSLLSFCLLIGAGVSAEDLKIRRFLLSTPYAQIGYFERCSGMGSENVVVEQKIVDANGQVVILKVPGALKFSDVTCRGGTCDNDALWKWRRLVETGRIEEARKNVFIETLDADLNVVLRWELLNAWPRKIVFSPDDCRGVDQFVLVSEGTKRLVVEPDVQ
jgi:phage tail-like protein